MYIKTRAYHLENYSQVSAFDLNSGEEELLPEMNSVRRCFTSILFGKFIYVFGGWNGTEIMNKCERWVCSHIQESIQLLIGPVSISVSTRRPRRGNPLNQWTLRAIMPLLQLSMDVFTSQVGEMIWAVWRMQSRYTIQIKINGYHILPWTRYGTLSRSLRLVNFYMRLDLMQVLKDMIRGILAGRW